MWRYLQVPATTRVHIWLINALRSICSDQVFTAVEENAETPTVTIYAFLNERLMLLTVATVHADCNCMSTQEHAEPSTIRPQANLAEGLAKSHIQAGAYSKTRIEKPHTQLWLVYIGV